MVSKKYSQLLSISEKKEVTLPKESSKGVSRDERLPDSRGRKQSEGGWPASPSNGGLGFWEEMVEDLRIVATNELPNKKSLKKDLSNLSLWMQGKRELRTGSSDEFSADGVMLDLDYHVQRVDKHDSFSSSVEAKYKTIGPSFSTAGSTAYQDTLTSSQFEDQKIAKRARDLANGKSEENESTVTGDFESTAGSEFESQAETEMCSVALSSSSRRSRRSDTSEESTGTEQISRESKMSAKERDSAAASRAKIFLLKGIATSGSETSNDDEEDDYETDGDSDDEDEESCAATEASHGTNMSDSPPASVAPETTDGTGSETPAEVCGETTETRGANEDTKMPVAMKAVEAKQEEALARPVEENVTKVPRVAKPVKEKKGFFSQKRWKKHAKE
jgi:hypothetical protein